MGLNSCMSSTRIVFICFFAIILMLTGLGMIGAVGYYALQIIRKGTPSIYTGCGVGLTTFLFPAIVLGGGYKSRCFLLFDNIIFVLLSIAECTGVGLYFIPATVDMVKKFLGFSEEYFKWIDSHMNIVAIAIGSLIALQFLFIIISGIHASELKKPEEDLSLPLTQETAPRQTYREKAREKYDLDKYNN